MDTAIMRRRAWVSLAALATLATVTAGSGLAAAGTTPDGEDEGSGGTVAGQPQGPFEQHPDGELTIGWVELTADCQSCVKALAEFNQFIEDNGYNWTVETLDSQGDPAAAASAIEDFTTRGVDAIVTGFVVLRASGAAIEAANAANIPVFSLDSGWTPGVVGDVTTNNFAMAGQLASYVADSLGGEGNVVSIWSDEHYGTVIRQEMLETITRSHYPGINILADENVTLAGHYQESIDAAEAFISRFGDDIDAVYCAFDEPCMAAATAFEAAGMEVPLFGFDAHQQALGQIRDGDGQSGLVASMAQQFGPFATTVGTWIQAILVEGRPVSEVIPVPEVYLPAILITPLNVPEEGVDGWTVPGYYDIVSGVAELDS